MIGARLLADMVLIVHALFIAFVVFGLLLIIAGWRYRWHWVRNLWFRVAHLAAILFVAVGSMLGATCPLTTLENALRVQAGQTGYSQSFIADWLHRLIFFDAAPWVFTLCYTLFALLVVVVWIRLPPGRWPASRPLSARSHH
jgi:hypothetical protein